MAFLPCFSCQQPVSVGLSLAMMDVLRIACLQAPQQQQQQADIAAVETALSPPAQQQQQQQQQPVGMWLPWEWPPLLPTAAVDCSAADQHEHSSRCVQAVLGCHHRCNLH